MGWISQSAITGTVMLRPFSFVVEALNLFLVKGTERPGQKCTSSEQIGRI